MELILQVFREFWLLSEEMAPYLLLGFLIAATLRLVVDESFVRQHLGQKGWRQTVKAALLGVPLPLCSCGVIPVAASLRRQGASSGAVTSFTASTPQTGVDSVFATAALLNWPFALIRVVVAFVNGIIAGTLVDRFADSSLVVKEEPEPDSCRGSSKSSPVPKSCCSEAEPIESKFTSCCSDSSPSPSPLHPPPPFSSCCSGGGDSVAPAKTEPSCCRENTQAIESAPVCCGAGKGASSPHRQFGLWRLQQAIRFGFLTLPADIGKALLFGLLLAGVLTVFLPTDLEASQWTQGPFAYLVTTLVAIPLYVCSTGSIPMAYALIHAGFSPGAALVFLIAGPATNTATVSALWKMLGGRAVIIYLVSLICVAWIVGILLDQIGTPLDFSKIHVHASTSRTLWKTASALLLYGLLGYGFQRSRSDRRKAASKEV